MNLQGKILALLHGELEQGKELSVLFEALANSSEGQRELLEQIAMSRHFSRLGDATMPSSKVDQQVLNAIAQRGPHHSIGQELAKVPSRLLFGGVISILFCSLISFFFGMRAGSMTEAYQELQKPLQTLPKVPEQATALSVLRGKPSEVTDTVIEEALTTSQNHALAPASNLEVKHRMSNAMLQNSGIYFNGKDNVVVVPDVKVAIDGNYTVEMSAYIDNLDQESWFLNYSTPDESGDLLFGIQDGGLRFLTYSLYESSNDIRVAQHVSLGTWHHIVYVQNVDEKVIQVYLDGKLIVETELKFLTPKSRTGTFYIGACNWYNTGRIDRFFQGGLSNIRIWNEALSIERVESNSSNKAMPIAYWPLSHVGQDMKVVDMSENKYDGVAQGELDTIDVDRN